jgi:hypothetical protein
LDEARPRSGASNRSFFIFNSLDMSFHVLRAIAPQRIGSPDYATDELKK